MVTHPTRRRSRSSGTSKYLLGSADDVYVFDSQKIPLTQELIDEVASFDNECVRMVAEELS